MLNGELALLDVGHGDSTAYIELAPGEHLVEIMPADTTPTAVSAPLDLVEGSYETAIAVGDGVNQALGVFALPAGPPGFFVPLVTP